MSRSFLLTKYDHFSYAVGVVEAIGRRHTGGGGKVSAMDNANKELEHAQQALDRSLARARGKALEFAFRARPCLSPKRQKFLREIIGDDDLEFVLVIECMLLIGESEDFLDLEMRLPTPLPLITRMALLTIGITNELSLLRHAQEMFDIKRRWAGSGGAAAEQARENSKVLRPPSETITANDGTNNSSTRRCANG